MREENFANFASLGQSREIKFLFDPENVDSRRLISAKFFKTGESRKLISAKYFDDDVLCLVIAIICTNLCEFASSRSQFTETPLFPDIQKRKYVSKLVSKQGAFVD